MTRYIYPGNDPENGPAYNPDARDRYGHPMYDCYGNRQYMRKDGKLYSGPGWRKDKRYEQKMLGGALVDAYYLGEEHGRRGMSNKNPYPAGRRHDAYDDGWNLSDPMGEYMGRNY